MASSTVMTNSLAGLKVQLATGSVVHVQTFLLILNITYISNKGRRAVMESSIVMTNPLVWLKVQLEAGSVMESSIVMTNPLVGLKVQLATSSVIHMQ